jgi:hypothetical protein
VDLEARLLQGHRGKRDGLASVFVSSHLSPKVPNSHCSSVSVFFCLDLEFDCLTVKRTRFLPAAGIVIGLAVNWLTSEGLTYVILELKTFLAKALAMIRGLTLKVVEGDTNGNGLVGKAFMGDAFGAKFRDFNEEVLFL